MVHALRSPQWATAQRDEELAGHQQPHTSSSLLAVPWARRSCLSTYYPFFPCSCDADKLHTHGSEYQKHSASCRITIELIAGKSHHTILSPSLRDDREDNTHYEFIMIKRTITTRERVCKPKRVIFSLFTEVSWEDEGAVVHSCTSSNRYFALNG